MNMLAEKVKVNSKAEIVNFPIKKQEIRIGKSTKMWCLKNREEIMQVYNFNKKRNSCEKKFNNVCMCY